jgi:hypothetical protein
VRSARDDIWIDMVQFDVRAADRLWEGIPPEHGAPGWYDDVSGLIETASGPAEPHELVDEPVVVEDMHQTTLGGHRCCRQGRTVGRLIAMKAAAATTAGVLGVAAAAAATTGIVATVASVVVPVIEEHVLPDDGQSATPATPPAGDTGGSPDTRTGGRPIDRAAAPSAAPAPPDGPQPADAEPAVASASSAPTAPTAEPVAELAPAEPAPAPTVVANPAPPPVPTGVAPSPPPATDPVAMRPARADGAGTDPPPAWPPHAGDQPDRMWRDQGRPAGDAPVGADAHRRDSWPGRSHRDTWQAHRGEARAATAADAVPPAPAAD